jgi:hypothetical protein
MRVCFEGSEHRIGFRQDVQRADGGGAEIYPC